MTTADDYINSVLDILPSATPLRSQIAMELRGHIAERVEHGHALDDVLRQLGNPERLAESYLSAVPLVSASFGRRAAAKIVDLFAALAVMALVGALASQLAPSGGFVVPIVVAVVLVGGSLLFGVYTVVAESRLGQTPGKRLLGLRVVRESGARISLGQAIVRQLPVFLQIYWIDAAFALFTERHQRAFELLSRTRVVCVSAQEVR
jgi:uncharacterized RDD family membrane protein YckC